MEMFFLSYVNETMYFLWNLPFFKIVPPKTNFWLIIAQQTSIHINCFMAEGGHTSGSPISKMHIVGEGPGETPSALRCLSYLINSFLTGIKSVQFSSVQLLSHVQLFATPWTAACQASLSITNSCSLLKLMSIESVIPSNHLILCQPLLLLPSIFSSIGLFK